ncbi:unnamed protein product [Diamesa hyperborea]
MKDFQIDFKKRNKRYNLLGPNKWETKKLSYHVSKYSQKIPDYIVDIELRRAFDVWSEHIDLEFHLESTDDVEIDIRFETGDHGCLMKFDGVRKNFEANALAHAFNPGNRPENGDIHFDDDEIWTFNSTEGSNLFQNAVHEIGHALGLDHTKLKKAVMFPYVASYYPGFKLDADDIMGIQELYGIKNKTSSRRLKVAPKACNISTIFNVNDKIMMFKGTRFYQMNESGVVENRSMEISSKWLKLPEGIDAAFNYLNNKTFFFKGSKYWRYSNGSMDEDYPKEIDIGFPGVPDSIDAVTTLSNSEVIYFFKGDLFWTFDSSNMLQGKQCFSMEIPLKFKGLPNDVDGAFKHSDGHVHFVKNNKLYRFNEVLQKVDQVLEHNWRC